MRYLFAIVLVISLGWGDRVAAQPALLDRPAKVRVTGEILPAEGQPREDLVTTPVVVYDTPLRLRVGKVEELPPVEREQAVKWGVLSRQVRLYGPAPLLAQVVSAKGTGKTLVIEGQLDTRDRQFLVRAVREAGRSR